jgi:hypothetical protein
MNAASSARIARPFGWQRTTERHALPGETLTMSKLETVPWVCG